MHEEKLKILMVGSAENTNLLGTEVAKAGELVQYRSVQNIAAMRDLLRQDDWDVVVLEANAENYIPSGILQALRDTGTDIPYLLFSGYLGARITGAAMRSGIHEYLQQKGTISGLMPVLADQLRDVTAASAKDDAKTRALQFTYHDEITGLPNRYLLREHVTQIFRIDRGDARSMAILFIGVERFGKISEAIGDDAAAGLLLEVAQRINRCFPDPGMVARVALDEFAACCLVGDRTQLQGIADSVRREFAAPFSVAGRHYHLTLSVGISMFPADGDEVATVLGNAESAMLLARSHGGDGTKFYGQKNRGAAPNTVALETDLPKALKNDELFLEYQPSVDLVTGRICGAEALVRWDHPQLGVVPPDRFIPLSDETGLIIDIGYWVLRQACAQARSWHDQGFPDLTVAVNFSAVQFSHAGLLERVQETLIETGLDPAALEIEVTETVSMQDVESTIDTLGALKDMGVRIVLDDFGMGYSCLRYLKQFPIDSLKIDQTFVRGVTRDRVDAALVRSIVGLGKTLGLRTVAEGVETKEQLDFLRAERCDRIQGFYFSKPIAAHAVLQMLRRRQRNAEPCPAV